MPFITNAVQCTAPAGNTRSKTQYSLISLHELKWTNLTVKNRSCKSGLHVTKYIHYNNWSSMVSTHIQFSNCCKTGRWG